MVADANENDDPKTTAKENRNNINAVASFTMLSPSNMVIKRRGAPSFFIILVAEVASVGERMAPNKKHSAQVKSGNMNLVIIAITTVVQITNPNASKIMGLKLNLKSCHEVK